MSKGNIVGFGRICDCGECVVGDNGKGDCCGGRGGGAEGEMVVLWTVGGCGVGWEDMDANLFTMSLAS